MKTNTIDAKMLFAQLAIGNALANASVNSALALFGYSKAKLKEGQALYEDASEKQNRQKQEYGDQYEASDELDLARIATNATYMRYLKVARIALQGQRGASQALDLDGRRKQSYSGWAAQATLFYTNAIDDNSIVADLLKFGIAKKALIAGLASVHDVEAKLAKQLIEKGQAQDATKVRDEAFEALQDWMSNYITIARIALEDQPQLLEMLGIVEPS